MATTKRHTAAKKAGRSSATSRSTNGKRPGSRPRDAIAILKADHREVEQLFKRFEKLGDDAHREKRAVVRQITEALSRHTSVEEQIVYPWARDYIEDEDDLVLEAYEEHRVAKWVLTELAATDPSDERFDARVTVLTELVRHHVKEEEHEFFPDLRSVATRSELLDLGRRIETAKRTAPTAPDLQGGSVAAAVEHARDIGKDVVDRLGALAGGG